MSNIERATELLEPGESALALFTRLPPGTPDDLFYIGSDGSGRTGNWPVDPNRVADKVIVYLVLEERPRRAAIYEADYVDAVKSPQEGRYVVRFQRGKQVGTTNRTWFKFADAGPNSVRYLP